MSPKKAAAPPVAPPSEETPVYTDAANHLTGTCDNCGKPGKFSYCVTNSTQHLHCCWSHICKDALEARLQVTPSQPQIRGGIIG